MTCCACYAGLCCGPLSWQVRDAFRRFMGQQPDAWDYSTSDIPSPLTDEMEATQQSKKVRPWQLAAPAAARVCLCLWSGVQASVCVCGCE